MTDDTHDPPGSPEPGRRSPLHDVHVAAGANFTDFAGWQMPVRYASELEEHRAVRTTAGLFDLSHMAVILVTGEGAAAALDHALSAPVSGLEVGRARYALVLSTEGGVIDDVIVYRTHDNRFGVVANAGNRHEAAGALSVRAAGFDATVIDESDALAILAVQGPVAEAVLLGLDALDLSVPVDQLRYFRSTTGSWRGDEVMVARTGYTGEDGFELYIRTGHAEALWNAIVDSGRPLGLLPAGLASRDTLRLEAGMPLYGHELSLDLRPEQAGLQRSVVLEGRGDFVGRSAVEQALADDAPVLVGLVSEGRRAGRAGYAVLDQDGAEVGRITSGALSPSLGHPIAMALVHPAHTDPGTVLAIDVRGTAIPATVTTLPFYKRTITPRKVTA